jgi:response regulator RpfG family c-di-GMP phosphodiesterase
MAMRILLVDDDPGLRALLRVTFETVDIAVEEAGSATTAKALIRLGHPDVVVLDVRMPGIDGLSFCRELKQDPKTRDIGVVLLTGSDVATEEDARAAGADGYLRKPFRPLELLAIVERISGDPIQLPFQTSKQKTPEQQLILYARDLRHVLEIERGQRRALQSAYQQTVSALGSALESRDTGTSAHSERVQRYALELTRIVDPELAEDPSVEYGFLLHDVGKIGIPDGILRKPGPLEDNERRLMQTHTVLGEQMLGDVVFLKGEGLKIVRHHHERWDGAGYPDGLVGTDIPLGARIFAVADAFDAMTSDRPYRAARDWHSAGAEIIDNAKRQFDPYVVEAFRRVEPKLREIHTRLAYAA